MLWMLSKGFLHIPNDISIMNCLYEMNSFSLTWWESRVWFTEGGPSGGGDHDGQNSSSGREVAGASEYPPFHRPVSEVFLFPTHPSPLLSHHQLFPRHDRRTHGHNQPPLKPNGEDHTETYYLYHIYLLSRGLISLFVWKEPHTLFFWRGWALTTTLRLLKSMFCWKLDVDIN